MSQEAQEAQALLNGLRETLPWKFHEVEQPEGWKGSPVMFGSLRTPKGKNVLQPFEGSNSTLMLPVPIRDFIINSPMIVKGLLDVIEQLEADVEIAQMELEKAQAAIPKKPASRAKKTAIVPETA